MSTAELALEPLGGALLVAAVALLGLAIAALVRGLRHAREVGAPMTKESSGLVLLLVVLAVIAAAYGWALAFPFSTAVGLA